MSCKKSKSCSCKFSPDIKIHQDIYSVWGFRKPTVPVLWATWALESPRLCCGTSDGRVAPGGWGQLGGRNEFYKELGLLWFFAKFLQDSTHFDGFVQFEQVDLLTAASAVISRMIAGHLGNCWFSLTDKIIWPAAIFVGTSSLTPLAVSVGQRLSRVKWCELCDAQLGSSQVRIDMINTVREEMRDQADHADRAFFDGFSKNSASFWNWNVWNEQLNYSLSLTQKHPKS